MSKFFIHRPVFAGVIAIIIVIAGLVSAKLLAVAQYPEIAPPTVLITTTYPGASAETLAKTVAAPIEEQLSGVEKLSYFSSTASSTGALSITVTFEPGANVDQAVFNVNNRVQIALPRLPDEVRRNRVIVQKRSFDILLVVSLVSPNNQRDTLYLSNFASINIVDELKRLPGLADVTIFGARDYSMRVWINPEKMARLGVTPSDVAQALRAQNAQYAAGRIGTEPAPPGQAIVYTVTATGRLVDPEQFGEIVIRAMGPNGVLRLKDIARIELGALNYDTSNTLDGQQTIGIATYLQPGANALEVAQLVRDRMKELKPSFPEGVDYTIPFDTTRFVDASIKEVNTTIYEAALLVLAVVFLFLQTWRATVIPMIAVPVPLLLRHAGIALAAFIAIVAVCVGLFLTVPGSFVPSEDQGYIFAGLQLPDGATMERTRNMAEQVSKIAQAEPGVQNVLAINGFDLIGGGTKTNAATMFVPLKHWDERGKQWPAARGAADIAQKGAALRDGIVIAFNPAAIRGLGTAGGFEFYLQARTNPDPQRLFEVTQSFLGALRENPRLTGMNSFFRPTVPQLKVEVDREKAMSLGVPVQDVFDALSSTMAALYVNDFNKFGRTFRVQVQADAPYRSQPEDLGAVYVRSTTTREMIPLKALIRVATVIGPEQLDRFNGFVAARVLGNGRPGVSSGEAIKAVEETAARALPEGYQIAWSGQAYQEKRTGRQSAIAFGLAIVMVFLILAALYERWLLPFAVVLAVPFAVFGALGFVAMRGLENDIYFQIGLVVLIGLAAKNAILIVEFAQQGFLEGKSAIDAALNAARLRFRPIIMTSLAFVLGVLPLMFSTGAGAAARRSMGTGVVGGMLFATFIATVFVPLFFVVMARRSKRGATPQPTSELVAK